MQLKQIFNKKIKLKHKDSRSENWKSTSFLIDKIEIRTKKLREFIQKNSENNLKIKEKKRDGTKEKTL